MPRRAALYLRVSTDRQETACQRPEVEQLVSARGYKVVGVYEETMSAAKERPAYARMMKDAKRGAFEVIVVWAIDRFGRSMVGNLGDVLELDRVGVQVFSRREQARAGRRADGRAGRRSGRRGRLKEELARGPRARGELHLNSMQPLKARVHNGRLILDEPTDLPEGAEVEMVVVDGDFDPEERARLLAAIDEGIEDFERGDHMDGFDFIAQMRAAREAAGR